jgi:two-component system response regulator TctD
MSVPVHRILVVDDENSIHFALRKYFLRRGYAVDSAVTVEDAFALLASNRYAVAILDIDLRGNDAAGGLKIASHIRLHAPNTPVMILSATESADARRCAHEAGARSYLCKPARLAQVADVAIGLMREQVDRTVLISA